MCQKLWNCFIGSIKGLLQAVVQLLNLYFDKAEITYVHNMRGNNKEFCENEIF